MRSSLSLAVAVVAASSVTVSVIGFLKNVLAAYYFGTSHEMDAYLLALLVPDVVMQLARTGVFNFIPLFAAERLRSEEAAWRAAGKMLSYWLLLLLAALVVAALSSPLVMPLLAPGFSPGQQEHTLVLTRTLFLMAATVGASRILAVALHAEMRFVTVAASETVFQVASTLYLILLSSLGIEALVWGQVFGGFCQLLVVAMGLHGRRHRIQPSLDLQSPPVRKMIRLTLPVYLSESGAKLNILVNRAFASLLPAGAISALTYAYTLVETLPGMLAGSLTSALFPFWSQRFAAKDDRGARESLRQAITTTVLSFAPLAAGLLLLAQPVVVVLFQRGSFDGESTSLTVSALRIFAPGIVAMGVSALIGSAFHARQDSATPMKAGLARVACNTVLCALLVGPYGSQGVAVASTAAAFLKMGVLLFFLSRAFSAAEAWHSLRALARVVPPILSMAAVLLPFSLYLIPEGPLRGAEGLLWLAAGTALGCAAYGAGLWLFWREELVLHSRLLLRGLDRMRRATTRSHEAPAEEPAPCVAPSASAPREAVAPVGFKGPVPVTPARRAVRRAVARMTRFAAGPEPSPALRILTYHRVNDGHPGDRLSVSSAVFRRQMEELAESGRPVLCLCQALPALRGEGPLPAGAVALTFDDGFRDNFDVALPILTRFRFPATFFVPTAVVGTDSILERYRGCCGEDQALDWGQVREMLARGHCVGGHGRTHRELAALSLSDVAQEVAGCRSDIEAATGWSARLFSYPRGSESPAVRRVVADAGFEGSCTVYPGSNAAGVDLFALRRTEVSGHDDLEDFRLKLAGGFDGWHRVLQQVQSWSAP